MKPSAQERDELVRKALTEPLTASEIARKINQPWCMFWPHIPESSSPKPAAIRVCLARLKAEIGSGRNPKFWIEK